MKDLLKEVKEGNEIYLNFDPKLMRANGFRAKRGLKGVHEVEVIKVYSNRIIIMFGNCYQLLVPMRLLKVMITDESNYINF